jgi:hypothetical protein
MQMFKTINPPDVDITRSNKLTINLYIFTDVSPYIIPYRNNINFLSNEFNALNSLDNQLGASEV